MKNPGKAALFQRRNYTLSAVGAQGKKISASTLYRSSKRRNCQKAPPGAWLPKRAPPKAREEAPIGFRRIECLADKFFSSLAQSHAPCVFFRAPLARLGHFAAFILYNFGALASCPKNTFSW